MIDLFKNYWSYDHIYELQSWITYNNKLARNDCVKFNFVKLNKSLIYNKFS